MHKVGSTYLFKGIITAQNNAGQMCLLIDLQRFG
jgi:hypothetical protein